MEVSTVIRTIIIVLCYLIILISLVPFIRSQKWFIRDFDYPRSQKFWINFVIAALFLFVINLQSLHDIVLLTALTGNQFYLLTLIWPYLPLAKKQMQHNNGDDHLNQIKIFIANVYQENKAFDKCIQMIRQRDPDIILLVETDQKWCDAMAQLKETYQYRIEKPQSNTYGMIVYSRLEITDHSIRFLLEPDVPSVVATVKDRNGRPFKLYCLHPKPPVPGESGDSTERDAEILLVGKEAKKVKEPVIVAGDLNDVAWSYTTKLFLKISELLDPRRGRGFYSTFHAKYWLFRWPLDHIFCSSHFLLHQLERLPFIGSDHFPIFISVTMMPHEVGANDQQEEHADAEERQEAEEMIEAANK